MEMNEWKFFTLLEYCISFAVASCRCTITLWSNWNGITSAPLLYDQRFSVELKIMCTTMSKYCKFLCILKFSLTIVQCNLISLFTHANAVNKFTFFTIRFEDSILCIFCKYYNTYPSLLHRFIALNNEQLFLSLLSFYELAQYWIAWVVSLVPWILFSGLNFVDFRLKEIVWLFLQ